MSEGDRPARESSPWGLVAVAVSLGFLVGGIIWPGVAESLLRILLIGLALGWGAARALAIGLPTATVYGTFSPFDSDLTDRLPPSIPDVVRRRARALTAADDPERGALRPIPWPVVQDLIHEAARRLEKGHGLRLGRPGDGARIRAMVSESTWTLLGLEGPSGAFEGAYHAIPLARLDDIIDDLERL